MERNDVRKILVNDPPLHKIVAQRVLRLIVMIPLVGLVILVIILKDREDLGVLMSDHNIMGVVFEKEKNNASAMAIDLLPGETKVMYFRYWGNLGDAEDMTFESIDISILGWGTFSWTDSKPVGILLKQNTTIDHATKHDLDVEKSSPQLPVLITIKNNSRATPRLEKHVGEGGERTASRAEETRHASRAKCKRVASMPNRLSYKEDSRRSAIVEVKVKETADFDRGVFDHEALSSTIEKSKMNSKGSTIRKLSDTPTSLAPRHVAVHPFAGDLDHEWPMDVVSAPDQDTDMPLHQEHEIREKRVEDDRPESKSSLLIEMSTDETSRGDIVIIVFMYGPAGNPVATTKNITLGAKEEIPSVRALEKLVKTPTLTKLTIESTGPPSVSRGEFVAGMSIKNTAARNKTVYLPIASHAKQHQKAIVPKNVEAYSENVQARLKEKTHDRVTIVPKSIMKTFKSNWEMSAPSRAFLDTVATEGGQRIDGVLPLVEVHSWNRRKATKGTVVLALTVFILIMVLAGVPLPFSFVTALMVCLVLGILEVKDAVKGFGNSGVITVGLLLPVAGALEQVDWVEKGAVKLLGAPSSTRMAQIKMGLIMIPLSGFFPTVPLVAILIPVFRNWSVTLGFSMGQLMMPLSFFACVGGNLSLLGSSANVIAQAAFESEYSMGIFDTLLGGLCMCVGGFFACILTAPMLLHSSEEGGKTKDQAAVTDTESGDASDNLKAEYFSTKWIISNKSVLAGKALKNLGLDQISGVKAVLGLVRQGQEVVAEDQQVVQDGDEVFVQVSASGYANLRAKDGMEMPHAVAQWVDQIGGARRTRALFEAVIANSKVGIFKSNPGALSCETVFFKLNAVVVAMRGPGVKGHTIAGDSKDSFDGAIVSNGTVLLLDGFTKTAPAAIRDLETLESEEFAVIHEVPGSTPPRKGDRKDKLRNIVVTFLFLLFIVACCIDLAPMLTLTLVLTLLYLFCDAISVSQFWNVVDLPVLIVCAAAIGFGAAYEKAGVSALLSRLLVSVHTSYGVLALFAVIYLIASFMASFISMAAAIGILAPVLSTVSRHVEEVELKAFIMLLCYSVNSCFCTPFGFPTHLMVMKPGGYSTGNFVMYGLPLQLILGVFAVLGTKLFY